MVECFDGLEEFLLLINQFAGKLYERKQLTASDGDIVGCYPDIHGGCGRVR